MLRRVFLCLLVSAALAEEEEKPSPEAVAIAATLLGAISFVMSLFYLTNHSDPEMRRYTYEVISITISIFCAVLLFQSGNDLVEVYVLEGASEGFHLLVAGLILVFWYCALQITLAVTSGAVDELIGWKSAPMEEAEASIRCYAVLLAHMTGFASINFWSGLQQTPLFSSSPAASLLTVPVSICGQLLLQRAAQAVRRRIALGDDGQEDEYEKLWDEQTVDAENDVAGLTLSWQTVQAARFLIGGALPNQEGEEPPAALAGHGAGEVLALLLLALAFAAAVFATLLRMHDLPALRVRVLQMVITVLSMGFAWSVFFGLDWVLAGSGLAGGDGMMLSVLLATAIFFLSFVVIRLLDKLYDAPWTGDNVDEAIRQIIGAIGILIGFAWEQCFDHATMSLSLVMPMPHLSKLLLALFCAVILVPAWRWFILPMVVAEGWRFGFVIRPDEKQWAELIQHDRFGEVMKVLDGLHRKVQDSPVAQQEADRVGRLRQNCEVIRGHSPGPEHVAQAGDRYVPLPGGAEDGGSGAKDLGDLKRKNAQLESTLTSLLSSYHEHMDRVQGTLVRIQNSTLPARHPAHLALTAAV